MFSIRQKREISEAIQKILRDTGHPELPEGEIQFHIEVWGNNSFSWARIRNNGVVENPSFNPHNEMMDQMDEDSVKAIKKFKNMEPGSDEYYKFLTNEYKKLTNIKKCVQKE